MRFRDTSLLVAACWTLFGCGTQESSSTPQRSNVSAHDEPPPPPAPLPNEIDLGGEPGPVKVGDFDDDGRPDLVSIVAVDDQGPQLRLVVAWGDETGELVERTQIPLPADPSRAETTRDASDNCIVIGDANRDERADIVTASGLALATGSRELLWQELPDAERHVLQPVGLTDVDGQRVVLRGHRGGYVERLPAEPTEEEGLAPLDPPTSACSPNTLCAIFDLVVADFDGDGVDDVFAGGPARSSEPPVYDSWLWLSSRIEDGPIGLNIDHADVQVGDVDADGRPDLVAQRTEFISDFPSETTIWINDGEGVGGFTPKHTLYNFDNHNDNAELADIDGDGCLDYAMIGVDRGGVGVRYGIRDEDGCTGFLGPHDPSMPVDVGWEFHETGESSIGIQQLDINGDGTEEWVSRDNLNRRLLIMPLPTVVRP